MKIIWMKFMNKFLLLLFLFLLNTSNAYAYLDPGSASIISQIIIFILAFFVGTFKKVKNFFNKLFKRKNKKWKEQYFGINFIRGKLN